MKRTFTLLLIGVALSFVGCIDRGFDLTDISGEVTVGGEELVVPLATVDNIYLSDLIPENEVIKNDENGVYQISFSSFGDNPEKYESLSIDGVSIPSITGLSPVLDPISFSDSIPELPTSLKLDGFQHEFDMEFPRINDIVKIMPITITQGIDIEIPSAILNLNTIPEHLVPYLPSLKDAAENEASFQAEISILKQLKRIDYVEFGCEDHPYGAPFEVEVDLNGLRDINGGGTIDLRVEFPTGYYLRDENGNNFEENAHNIIAKKFTLSAKQRSVKLLVYLHKIDYSDHEFKEGLLEIDDRIKYSYDLNIGLCAGTFDLTSMPSFKLAAEPKYKDVRVCINHFDAPELEHNFNYTFNGMPDAVSIEKIAFKSGSDLKVNLQGLKDLTIVDNVTNEQIPLLLELTMPKCMVFRPNSLINSETNTIIASIADLSNGITLSLDHINCKAESVKQENGTLTLNEIIKATVHLENLDNHIIVASSLKPLEGAKISVGVSDATLTVDTANSIVIWNETTSFDFNLKDQIPSISQTIDIPSMIAEIERIEIGDAKYSNEPVSMQFSIGTANGKRFPINVVDINVEVNLGKMLRPTQEMFDNGIITKTKSGDYILRIDESWYPNNTKLERTLKFDALENLPAIVNNKMTINQTFPVVGGIKIKSGQNIDLSAIKDVEVDIDVKISDIEVRKFTGKVDISVAPENVSVDLSEMSNLGVDINELSINPVFKVNLKDNPTGIPFNADIAIKTFNAKGEAKPLDIPQITIAGSGPTNLVISTPKNRSKYETEGVTFIAVENLSQLLSGGIPTKIAVDMEVATDKSQTYTIDLSRAKQGYKLEYQYEVFVPLEFDGAVDLSYSTTIADLNETFASLADEMNGLKVGDVGLVAEFGTTIPFDIKLDAVLVNKEGTTENINAKLTLSNNGTINGWTKADGDNAHISTLIIDFDLGKEHSLASLKNVDGIKLSFTLTNADDTAAIAKDQYLNGNIKLRVRDGLTIDIFDLLQ